jgi:hypothetical protein
MKATSRSYGRTCAFMMTEALVYIGVVMLLLGVGYAAMYRCIDNSVVLRRNANDITRSIQAGERWRNDVRGSSGGLRLEATPEGQVLRLAQARGTVDYRFEEGTVYRRSNGGSWVKAIDGVTSSSMAEDVRTNVVAWRWELELKPQVKGAVKPGAVRPLFTFLAVPQPHTAP